jgi:hypothetical protein
MAATDTRNHSWLRSLAASLTAALLVTACGGGGGGGGGGSQPPPTGTGDTEKFFPDAVGDAWFYDVVVGDPTEPNLHEHGFGQMAVTGTKSFGSVVAKVFTMTSPSDPAASLETYLSRDSNGVTNHGNNDPSDTLTRAIVPYLEGKFPVTPGLITDISRSGIDYGSDLDGDGKNEKVDFSLRITMDGFEAQSVPAGTYARTAKRTSRFEGTVRTTASGGVPFTASEQLWSAPGVGIIKQFITVSVLGIGDQESYAARGYKVDGVAHGIGLPRSFLDGLSTGDATLPASASNGTNGFAVAIVRQTGVSPIASKVVAAFGDADGAFLREVDVTAPTDGYMIGRAIGMAFDGTNYLLLYSHGTSNTTPNPLLATRISPSGTVLDGPMGFEVDGGSVWMGAAAFGNNNYLVVYVRYDDATGMHQLHGRLVTPAGSVSGEFPIGPRDQTQLYPAVAFDGTNFLVVWQQQPGSGSDVSEAKIMAARVSETPEVLDPAGIAISATGKGSSTPRVGFGGGQYLVAWVDGRNSAGYFEGFDIYAARVDTNGVLVDGPATTGGLRISGDKIPETGYPGVCYSGSEFLLTWNAGAYTNITAQSGIFGARVAANGAVDRGGSDYGIALSGEPPQASPTRYTHATPVRLDSRRVVTWLDNDGGSIRDVVVYSLE